MNTSERFVTPCLLPDEYERELLTILIEKLLDATELRRYVSAEIAERNAITALEAVAPMIRSAAIEEAAKVAEHPNAGLVPPDGGDPSPTELAANIAAAIRALAPSVAGEERE